MAFSKPLTNEEREYIRSSLLEKLPKEKIAENIGRSVRTVQKIASEMKEEIEAANKARIYTITPQVVTNSYGDAKRQDTYGRLCEVREILRSNLLGCEPQQVASIAKAYRETLQDITEIEGKYRNEPQAADPIAARLKLVSFG